MNRLRLLALSPLLLFLVLTGCAGYKLGSVKPEKLSDVQTIAIPTFKNLTLEPRTSVLMTNTVIKQFQEDGTYKIAREDDADAILFGTFRQVDRTQLRAVATDQLQTRELGIRLVVDYVLMDTNTNQPLEQGTVFGSTDIFLDPNFQLSERQAFPVAASEVANQLVSQLSEGW